jgi:hypothetical protein
MGNIQNCDNYINVSSSQTYNLYFDWMTSYPLSMSECVIRSLEGKPQYNEVFYTEIKDTQKVDVYTLIARLVAV